MIQNFTLMMQVLATSGGASEFILTLMTSLGASGIVGFLFWSWLNNKFESLKSSILENKSRLLDLEHNQARLISKEDHTVIRREDRDGIEKQIDEVKRDIKEMPEKLVNLLKPFLTNK